MAKEGLGLRRDREVWPDPGLGLRLLLEVGRGWEQGWAFQDGPTAHSRAWVVWDPGDTKPHP